MLEFFQAGAFVFFGKHDIETNHVGLVMIEQIVDYGGQLVASPGPSTHFGERIFIDVDDDHAVID